LLEDVAGIQSRIAEIQQKIDALSPPVSLGTPQRNFSETLTNAQSGHDSLYPSDVADSMRNAGMLPTATHVPCASLGPLPSAPLNPNNTSNGVEVVPFQLGAQNPGSGPYDSLIESYAEKYGVSPQLVRAVIKTESGGNTHAVSRAGAMGLMQLMPSDVKDAGIADPFDAEQNIDAGTKQLSNLLNKYHGNLDLTLAGYNAGPGNVRKYGGVPPFTETQNYIRKVRAAMDGE
jgi:hypothetical protein